MNSSIRSLYALTAIWVTGLIVSGFHPYDRLTWLMEVAPTLIALPLLLATCTKFRFTELAYGLIAVHGLILMLGGAYTYARVPLGSWIQDWFHLGRNPYDKIGHFAQGFVPAIVARELLLQHFSIRSRKLVTFLAISICLAVSALYELIEWGAALALGQGSDEFLGTQGDPWDTQSDMFFALIGAVCALALLSRWHDKAMRKTAPMKPSTPATSA
jgi:putative membrane protein